MNICLFDKDEIKNPLSLKDERAEHILKILHKKVGDTFSSGIINGKSGTAKITNISGNGISFDFKAEENGKPLFPLKMIIGFPRPIQLKRLLRDIAALGASEIHLTGTELGEKSYMKSNLVERGTAYKMLLDGTVQAASTHIPELFLHKTLKDCLEHIEIEEKENDEKKSQLQTNRRKSTNDSEAAISKPLKICLDNINPNESLVSLLERNKNSGNGAKNFIAAIGNERGWTDKERKILEEHGFVRCGMGSRVMRTETAATVSASVISAYAGFFDESFAVK